MFALVSAPGHWWAARHQQRHPHLVLIGLLGKVLGPLGFLWSLADGRHPLAFDWTVLANNPIWWPAFAPYLREAARQRGGWGTLLRGE